MSFFKFLRLNKRRQRTHSSKIYILMTLKVNLAFVLDSEIGHYLYVETCVKVYKQKYGYCN